MLLSNPKNKEMKYYHEKTLKNVSFEEAIQKVTEALKVEGFGILTEIDVQATLKKKLDEDIQPYRILGACNPSYAHKAILAEDKIGVMLPCNVIVQQKEDGVEVAAVDPMASMQAIENKDLVKIAEEIQSKLKGVIDTL
jgi:uncharacterized protein (DUF302 family)